MVRRPDTPVDQQDLIAAGCTGAWRKTEAGGDMFVVKQRFDIGTAAVHWRAVAAHDPETGVWYRGVFPPPAPLKGIEFTEVRQESFERILSYGPAKAVKIRMAEAFDGERETESRLGGSVHQP
jgi:hypothetical protein